MNIICPTFTERRWTLPGISIVTFGTRNMNELTLEELIEKIKLRMDPYWLLETLDLEFSELVDHLRDAIEDDYDNIVGELDEEEDE